MDSNATLPAGRAFAPEELVFFAGRGQRTLDDALGTADLLVATPHVGSALPAELEPFLAPEFAASLRLRLDFTDVATRAVARRWAEIDPRIVVVENPHPRLVRDPNRPRPADGRAQLIAAFARIRAAQAADVDLARLDLSGVDAVRPITFAGLPIFTPPADEAAHDRLAESLRQVATRGVDVYERTRDDLFDRLVARRIRSAGSPSGLCFFLSFHDTMNAIAAADGAIAVERDAAARMPQVLALSNRGDRQGEARGREPVTLWPALLRRLASAHRDAFDASGPGDVALNRPFAGSHEITRFGALCRDLTQRAQAPGLVFGAVQAEFRREYLLGEEATAHLVKPGTDWPATDAALVNVVAQRLRSAWDGFRESLPHAR